MWKNRNVIVFGGTGTIGSLIVERLLYTDVNTIRIFTNDEYSLWKFQEKNTSPRLRYLLGDIRDYERVKRALRSIDYVFNAAAIKHVPVAEYEPIEAVKTNILGLDNIINAAIEQKVVRLLHISTDKAVEPTSVMGATKMISERVLQMRWAQNPFTQMICVRLGNVWGSRGSIINKAKKCVKEGKPITITDTNMTRFFMTPKETSEFIMKAFTEGKNGEIWIPKLKEQKLMDVITAEFGQCSIEIIGSRKGEKLSERMLSHGEIGDVIDTNRNYWILPNDYLRWLNY